MSKTLTTSPALTVTSIGESYQSTPPAQASLVAGIGASIATVTLFVAFALIALPSAAFA